MKWDVPGTYTWIAPANKVWVSMVAGGGGGSSYSDHNDGLYPGLYGGGGGGTLQTPVNITPGETITIVVGAGGKGGVGINSVGSNGGNSSFGTYLTVNGGKGGTFAGDGAPGGFGASSNGDSLFGHAVAVGYYSPEAIGYGAGGCGALRVFTGGNGSSGLVIVEW